jgi:hypothetical protein
VTDETQDVNAAARLCEFFLGNKDRHVRGFGPPTRDEQKHKWKLDYSTYDKPVTLAHWRDHLNGSTSKYILTIIPLLNDGTCYFAGIDVDEYELDYHQICRSIETHKFPLLAFVSKSGGLHLFVFFKEPTPATIIVPCLHYMAKQLGLKKYEIFPSSPTTKPGEYTKAINMPYGNTWDLLPEQHMLSSSGHAQLLKDCLYTIESARITVDQLPVVSETNSATVGGFEWSSGYGQQKLDDYCEIIRTAQIHYWDEATRKLYWFARMVGGGAYESSAALDAILTAAKQNTNAPDDYVDKVKRTFLKGIADPVEPPKKARVEVLPESQWFGERPKELPPALIKGVLPQTGVAMIGGQSGGGKTFHGIHLGACLIPDCKQNFYIDKYRIKRKGGVLYFVLEGEGRFPTPMHNCIRNHVE